MTRTQKLGKLRAWREAVFGCLAAQLEPLGFRRRKNWQEFHRQISKDVQQGFHLNFGSYLSPSLHLDVIPSANVRHERVEKLAFGWRPDLSEAWKKRKQTATIGQRLAVLGSGSGKIWGIRDDSEIHPACVEILDLIWQVGLPYVARFSDLRMTLESLENEGLLALRCHSLPIIKALLDGPESAIPYFQREYDLLRQHDDPNTKDYPLFVRAMEKEFGIRIEFAGGGKRSSAPEKEG